MKLDDDLDPGVKDLIRRGADELATGEPPPVAGVVARGRRRRVVRLASLGTSVLAVAGGLSWGLVSLSGVHHPQVSSKPTPHVHPRVIATVPVGPYPQAIAVGENGVWVSVPAQHPSRTNRIVRLSQGDNAVAEVIPVPSAVDHLVAGYGAVWASAYERHAGRVVLRIDPRTGHVRAVIPNAGGYMALGGGSIWTSGTDVQGGTPSEISRIDPATNQITATIRLQAEAPYIAYGDGALWAIVSSGPGNPIGLPYVIKIDPATNRVMDTITGPSLFDDLLAPGNGSVWVSGSMGPKSQPAAIRIDSRTDRVIGRPVPLPGGFDPIATDPKGVWFLGSSHGTLLSHLNSTTHRVDASVRLPGEPAYAVPPSAVLDPATHRMWIADYRNSVTRVDLLVDG